MRHGIKMFALAVMLVVTGVAITQQPNEDGPPKEKKGPPPPKGGFDFLARIVGDLKLSAGDKAKVEPIVKAHEEKLRELFKKFHEAHKKLDEEALSDLKGVLKEMQFQRVEDELKKGPPGKDFDKKGKGDRKGPPPDKKDDAALRQALREIAAEVRDSLRQVVGKRSGGKCAD